MSIASKQPKSKQPKSKQPKSKQPKSKQPEQVLYEVTPGVDKYVIVTPGGSVKFLPLDGNLPRNLSLTLVPGNSKTPPLFKMPFNVAFEISPKATGEYTYSLVIGTGQEPIEGKIVVNSGPGDTKARPSRAKSRTAQRKD